MNREELFDVTVIGGGDMQGFIQLFIVDSEK